MKTDRYLISLLLAGFLVASCEKEDFRYQNAFEKSYQHWLDFKGKNNDSYRFTVTDGTWAGFGWQTTLTVKNGEVVQRDFRYTVFNQIIVPPDGWTEQRAQEILDSLTATHPDRGFAVTAQELAAQASPWTEKGEELSSHGTSSAAPLMTLDEIYDLARTVWLIKRDDASTSFEANNDGLISSSGYWVNGCQDDCFVGINIVSIEEMP